jgi:hypothetical protein
LIFSLTNRLLSRSFFADSVGQALEGLLTASSLGYVTSLAGMFLNFSSLKGILASAILIKKSNAYPQFAD